ncbi:MAG: c-type cytochrome biogenesis protein CcmI [Rhizomicrobium sp.]|nr:c-type cytochrome biogenesis protein CcmI [Rhizomicrobium sp.]
MLWLLFAVLCLAVLAMLVVPLLRGGAEARPRVDYDIVVYRSQLAEIDQEVEEGLLTAEQAEAARAEVHRRMLAAEDAELQLPQQPLARASKYARLGAIVAIALIIPIGSGALYAALGSPSLPGKPYMWRIHNDPEFGAAASADALAAQVQANPSAEGYEQLGRTYFASRQYEQAAGAYRHAIDMGAKAAVTWSEFGEALVMTSGGSVGPEAMAAFSKAIQAEPRSERSRFYLGLAEAQIGNMRQAVAIWRDLEKTSDPAAPWLPMLREHITAFAKQGGFDAASVPPSPPDLKAIGTALTAMTNAIHLNAGVQPSSGAPAAAAPAASPAAPDASAAAPDVARDPQIIAMVQRLAERLEKTPDDFTGWQRLAHAYVVMGDLPKARQAAEHLVRLKPNDVTAQMALAEVQKAAAPGEEPPKDFIATMRKVLTLDAGNAQALYFVGVAEAKAGHSAEARTLWTKALTAVPSDDPMAATIRAKLAALPK